jgi:large subunit ribosomal protein L23
MASIKKNIYQIIRRPRITEKSAMIGSVNRGVVFEVHPLANKAEIKKAVEEIFDVKVKAVRTASYMGKIKRVGRRIGRRGAWKKAYVFLKEGSSIDIIEGL